MNSMERYKGHFYNWYDTQTLEPLLPKYISTVDSGNLAGHLLTAKQGLLAVPHQTIATRKLIKGIRDTWYVLNDCLKDEDKALFTIFDGDIESASHSDLSSPEKIKLQLDILSKSYALIFDTSIEEESETYWWKRTSIA